MSDQLHSGRRSRSSVESGIIESRLMFAACYALFLLRAVATRLMPWRRKQVLSERSGKRESIFKEANSEASVLVTSSFMGL